MNLRLAAAVFLIALSSVASSANATLVITFTNGGFFDNDVAGSQAPTAPANFTDPDTSLTGRITTSSVVGGTSAALNENSGTLGIDSNVSGDQGDAFDPTESWSFSWNTTTEFAGIDFTDYEESTSGDDRDEEFRIQSNDWIGRSITPGSTNVVFDMLSGTFIFDNDESSDDFSVAEIGGAVALAANAIVTISFADLDASGGNDDGDSQIQDMAWNIVAVPEPGAFLFGGMVCGVIGLVVGGRWLFAKLVARG